MSTRAQDRREARALATAAVLSLLAVGCGGSTTAQSTSSPSTSPAAAVSPAAATSADATNSEPTSEEATTTTTSTTTSAETADTAPTTTRPERHGQAPPAWLGTRELPLRPDEHGVAQPTPPDLATRELWTVDTLPPPVSTGFESTIHRHVPESVLARSTWQDGCPVTIDELSYATLTFVGFDGRHHTGELLTNSEWIDELVGVFGALFEMGFPIEEMRVTTPADVAAHPTGDSNNTGSFVCRPTVTSNGWSQHAYGLAIDINPFHNPFHRGELVIPELASAFLDRSDMRRGMVTDLVVELFDDIGWGWGGRWANSSDWMHFSSTGH